MERKREAEQQMWLEDVRNSESESESSEEKEQAVPAKPDTDKRQGEQVSLMILKVLLRENLDLLYRVLKAEECGLLSIAQSGGLLPLVCMRSGANLGEPGSDDGKLEDSAMFCVLLLWTDSKKEMKRLFEKGDYIERLETQTRRLSVTRC